jgi:hypothetical protein
MVFLSPSIQIAPVVGQDLLPSRLLSKNLKIRIYKTIILPVLLYWCEIWPLTLKEEHGPGGCLKTRC